MALDMDANTLEFRKGGRVIGETIDIDNDDRAVGYHIAITTGMRAKGASVTMV